MPWMSDTDPWLPKATRAAAQMARGEKTILEAVAAAFQAFMDEVRRTVLAGEYPALARWPTETAWARIAERIVEAVVALWRKAHGTVTDAIDAAMENRYVRQVEAQMKDSTFPAALFAVFKETLAGLYDSGATAAVIKETLSGLLSMAALRPGAAPSVEELGHYMWRNRARTVARVTTTQSWNAGVITAAKKRERDEGIKLYKRWINEHDSRVRSSHRDVGGQTVRVHEPFTVGAFDVKLQYPGDPTGPPEEVINCRCHPLILTETEAANHGAQ